jgi:glycosyltransferase involved in cell wall biosynthesis
MRRTAWSIADRLPNGVRRLAKRLPGGERLRRIATGAPHGPPPPPGTLRPVVYLPTWARWDVMRQRPQYLLSALADQGHPVYFVDPRERRRRSVGGVTIVPSLEEVPADHVILYVHFAPLHGLATAFHDPVVVYDILDDLTIYEPDEIGLPTERTVAHHHPRIMTSAHHVLASNSVLAERHRAERGDLIIVENGVDVGAFSADAPRPPDLPMTDGPVIGYRGAIAEWFDFDLLREVAEAQPEMSFVLVGPVDARVAADAGALEALPNVTFLGERPPDSMPGYARAFDVEAVWFDVNEMTEGVTPLKVYEALAAGTPVVSTPLPACEGIPVVRTAADAGAFGSALRAALDDAEDPSWGTRARDVAVAADWSHRVRPLVDRLSATGQALVP